MIKVAASIMCGNPLKIGEELKRLENAKVDMLHCDVMDGTFVHNLGMGLYVIEAIKDKTKIPLDVHLAIVKPERYLKDLAKIGVDIAAFHVEAAGSLVNVVKEIKTLGMKACAVLNPETPVSSIKDILDELYMVNVLTVHPGFSGQRIIPETINKIRELKHILLERNLKTLIEVDGSINIKTLPMVIPAGADVLVAGTSSMFQGEHADYKAKADELRSAAYNILKETQKN
ncbi:ribulose-phosphate 3-epimerase [Clostridium sp. JN-9]|uniref:ribulose-phosphate 3-epimerase n=1 Tax=Clostridium sp. JN-9 TaxID=2507159 RepID=UPI000FFE154B|nr:ribulose-phosphate 3-epimerase [Clostridium sp. JN-9]QAT39231.1 ribulose-phosphate 3-epimerase [Clostridium sp. JN-9]